MRYLIVVLSLIFVSGCETFGAKYGDIEESTRALYSESSLVRDWIAGGTKSCVIMSTKDQLGRISGYKFTVSEDGGSCEVTIDEERND